MRTALIAAVAPVMLAVACTPEPAGPPPPAGADTTTTTASSAAPASTTVPLTTVRSVTGPGFNITIRFAANLPTAQVQPAIDAFNAAASNWEKVITGDLTDVAPTNFNGCDGAGPVGSIDDVLIDVSVRPIDGAGGVLGSAGWCGRSGTTARAGAMTFDSADVGAWLAQGKFDRVVTHEMGHVLGIGTMWNNTPYLDTSSPTDPRFTGPKAVAAWNLLSGRSDTGVPVEATGGPGTALAHWRESTFRSELMTGWISLGASPLSTVSVASLEDLGFTVNINGADPYVLGSLTQAITPSVEAHSTTGAAGAGTTGGFILTTPDGPIGSE